MQPARLASCAVSFFLAAPVILAAPVSFEHDIAPIFQASCAKCHGTDTAMGKLTLATEADVLRGGSSGPAIVPGKSSESLLIKRLLGLDDMTRMPMGGDPLPDAQVSLIRQWIDHGDFSAAKESAASAPVNAGPKAAESSGSSTVFAEKVRPILAARCYQCHGPQV